MRTDKVLAVNRHNIFVFHNSGYTKVRTVLRFVICDIIKKKKQSAATMPQKNANTKTTALEQKVERKKNNYP